MKHVLLAVFSSLCLVHLLLVASQSSSQQALVVSGVWLSLVFDVLATHHHSS